MRRLTRGTIREARNILTLTRARTSGGVAGGVAMSQPTAQNQMLIANAIPAWSLLAAPLAQNQVLVTDADPYTPAWAARFDITVPNTIEPGDAAAAGSATVSARRDHEHAIVCTAPASPSVSLAASAEGSGASFARADHTHQLSQAIAPTWISGHMFTGGISSVRATASIAAFYAYVTGDSFARLSIKASGEISFGSGAAGLDVKLYRSAANTLRLEDTFVVDAGITLNGATGANPITIPDDMVQAMHLVDAGATEYMGITSTNTQPVLIFNEGGADIDYRWGAVGQANALFLQGSTGNLGAKTDEPATDLHIVGTAVTNKNYGNYRTLILEDDNAALQLIGKDDTTGLAHIILTGAPTSGDNKHWIISHLGPVASNRFSVGYKTTSADDFVVHAPTEHFVILLDGRTAIGTTSPATSALLHLHSTTGALLVPRMTTTQRDALTAVHGMIIYNTTTGVFNFREYNQNWVGLNGIKEFPWVIPDPAVGTCGQIYIPLACTVTGVYGNIVGGTSCTLNIEERSTLGASGTNILSSDMVADANGESVTSGFNNSSLAAGNYLTIDVSAVSGAVDEVSVSLVVTLA